MRAYYNDSDPFKCEVVREAIKAGAVAPGIVDERSIEDVQPEDLKDFVQVHMFCGGAFWSLALRQAGWPDDRPVWTGSCPCPSFSAAGTGQGFADPRHLWPAWARLIRECHPPTIFGEQVSAAIGHGWLDLVQTDLEAQEYAVGKAVLGACSVGAPHIRQRLYFVAQPQCQIERGRRLPGPDQGGAPVGAGAPTQSFGRSLAGGLADAADARRQTAGQYRSGQPFFPARSKQCGNAGFLGDTEGRGLGMRGSTPRSGGYADGTEFTGSMDKPIRTGLERYSGDGDNRNQSGRVGEIPTGPVATTGKPGELADADGGNSGSERQQRSGQQRQQSQDGGIGGVADTKLPEGWQGAIGRSDDEPAQAGWDESTSGTRERNTIERSGPVNGWWAGADWIGCRDGKFRPVPGTTESGPLSMVDGDFADLGYFLLPSGRGFAFSPLIKKGKERAGRLRLYGDAICIPAAQAFIESYLETEQ